MNSVSLTQNNTSKWLALILLAVIGIIGLGLINKLSSSEYDRDIQNWQSRLSLMADVREELVNNWMSEQYGTLSSLANNQSLRLYLTQISNNTGNVNAETQTAQRNYLNNLLLQTAKNNGFFEELSVTQIKANVRIPRNAGIAIVSAEGKVIAATLGMPILDKLSLEKIKSSARNRDKLIRDIYFNQYAEKVIAFIIPAPTIINTNSSKPTIHSIIGIRKLNDGLYPLLDKEIFSTKTDESILVRQHLGEVIYLNKPNANNKNMFLRFPHDPNNIASAYALKTPGAFGIKNNYKGQEILFISRQIAGTSWLLLQTISYNEALQSSKDRQKQLVISFALGLAALIFILIASWRHGASLYAKKYNAVLEEKSNLLTKQNNILQSVTDNIGDLILIINKNRQITFSNMHVASLYQLQPNDLIGKSLIATFGNKAGEILHQHVITSQNTSQPVISVHKLNLKNIDKNYHCSFFPINKQDTLIVLHDITELRNAENKHKRLMKHLVHTLTHVIDSYVPDSANHSSKTTKLASAIAKELNLSNVELETLELAACLSNIGKLFIPREILQKTTKLTDDERSILQSTINQTANILVDLEFDGPVLETIAQKNEHVDGSGYPGGISGERILLTARILTVANAFVAMQSPRVYRDSLSVSDILDQLYDDSGKIYDKRVIAALMHTAENKQESL